MGCCSASSGCCSRKSAAIAAGNVNPWATFETTHGIFKAEIFLDRVHRTASNFIDLAQSNFYNGIHFHRVIPRFMCQFGCPFARDPRALNLGTGYPPDGPFQNLKTRATEMRSNGGKIQDENISKDSNKPGTLSMANNGQPNTGGSQFYINVADNYFLDWWQPPADSKHPVFGKVSADTFAIVEAMSKVKTQNECPVEPIRMISIRIELG
mmetsp:Transcript_31003/g.49898  ORF Transcript_31003/g.49898 Transcript_31003/m.49898 type:complete len:210 (+) Transcript_31003:59-688(+)